MGPDLYEEILEISDQIGLNKIDSERNYWLVRSRGGQYFDEFYFENFIAIGWNRASDIKAIEQGKIDLKTEIGEHYPNEKRPGYVANQIIRFVNEMKSGDIVLTPNKDSKFVAFGEIIEDDAYIEDIDDAILLEEQCELSGADLVEENEELQCPYIKRRRVRWIKTIKRSKLDPYLFKLLYSHNTISDASEYASYIDRSLHSFFVKNGEFHIIYEVNKKDDVAAIDLIKGINTIISSIDVFNNVAGSNYDKHKIDIKINVQSPGPIEFITYCAGAALILGTLSMFLFGGNFEFLFTKDEKKMRIDNLGLLGTILKFREQKHKHDVDIKKLEEGLKETRENLELIVPNEENSNDK